MAAPTVANSAIGNALGVTAVTTAGVTTTTGNRFLVLVPPYPTTPTSVTDSKGNTYSLKVSYLWASFGATFTVYECVNGTGGAGHTATVNWSSSGNRSATFLEIASSAGTDCTVTAADASSPYTITSWGLASSAELGILLGAADGVANPATFAESTGFTIRQSQQDNTNYNAYFVASKDLTGTNGPITPSFTSTGSSTGASILMTFTPIVSPATTPGTLGQWDQCLRIEGWF